MRKKVIILFLILAFPMLIIGQGQTDYQLIFEEPTYRVGDSRLDFFLTIQNNSEDTLVMIRPTFNQFKEHYNFQPISIIGEISKPYSLELIIVQDCTEESELMAPIQDYPKMVYLFKSNLVIIPPGERSRRHRVFINFAGFEFCEEGVYEAQITYNPEYETLNSKQLKFLNEKKKDFDAMASKAQKYIEKEQLSPDTLSTSGTLLHLVLDNDKYIRALTPETITSSQIILNPK
jgi:hypothetical protein